MICHVYKQKRRDTRTGRTVASRLYSGRYRLDGESKARTVALGVSDKQAAEAKLREIVRDKERERCGVIAPETSRRDALRPISELVSEFVADRQRVGRCAGHVRQLREKLARLGKECSWRTVGDITAASFVAWRTRQATLSAKTLNEYHHAVSAFCNWLRRQGRGFSENPFNMIEKVSLVGQETFKRRALTAVEITSLLTHSEDRRAIYVLAIYTGLRRGELAKLVWSDLTLEGETPSVRVRASTAKNRKDAELGLHPRAAIELLAVRAALGNVMPQQPVFAAGLPSPDQFQADLDAAGISRTETNRVDFHSLRHTFGTLLSLNGVTPRVAMEAMRHSDMKLTMKTYTDAAQLPVSDAVNALPDFVSPANGDTAKDDTQTRTHIRTQSLGVEGLSMSPAGAHPENIIRPQTLMDTITERLLALSGADGHGSEENARCRVRTCDFLRVKQALYH